MGPWSRVTQQHNQGCPVTHLVHREGAVPALPRAPAGLVSLGSLFLLAGMLRSLWSWSSLSRSLMVQPEHPEQQCRGTSRLRLSHLLVLCTRALRVQSPSKAHQTEMLCSRTRMQQFCSHLAHLSPVACLPRGSLPGGSSCCADSKLVLTLGEEGAESTTESSQMLLVHQCRHKVHSRRTSAYREHCAGLVMLE